MKRKKTIVRPDGSKEIIEEDDQAPVHHKHDLDAKKQGTPPAKQYLDRMASKGHGGDTKLAHVNQWEEALLKKLGGAGTKNPHTGLRQYFTIPGQPDDPDYLMGYQPSTGSSNTSVGTYTQPGIPDAPMTPEQAAVQLAKSRDDWASGKVTSPMPTPASPVGTVSQTTPVRGVATDGSSTDMFNIPLDIMPTSTTTTPVPGMGTSTNMPVASPPPGPYVPPVSAAPPTTTPPAVVPPASVPATIPPASTLPATIPPATVAPTAEQVIPATTSAVDTTGTDMFNIPTDIKPFSVSGSQSQSGLPNQYRDQLLASLMPQLQQSITDMPGNWDKYTNEALGSYQQMMNNALRTNIPKALAGLSNRGILNSTEGQGVLGNVYSQAAMDAANEGYGTAMQAALGKANMPTVLGQIAQLGQGTQSNQFSYAEDPTTMYRDLSATIRAMMG